MYIFIAMGLILLIVIVIFAFPRFSPIPYFPSNKRDMPLILSALHISKDQVIVDLGAGDGIVIFKAAEEAFNNKLNTTFVAVEINPVLLAILYFRRLLHPNRNNIQIVNKDMFVMNYSNLIPNLQSPVSNLQSPISNSPPLVTFYIYISPWFIEKTVLNITKQIKKFSLVSYFYQVKCLPNYTEELKEGVHKIYRYENSK